MNPSIEMRMTHAVAVVVVALTFSVGVVAIDLKINASMRIDFCVCVCCESFGKEFRLKLKNIKRLKSEERRGKNTQNEREKK